MSSKHPLPGKRRKRQQTPSVAVRAAVNAPDDPRRASRGRWNYYACPECHTYYVTVDVDPGTTPAFLRCMDRPVVIDGKPARYGSCTGTMTSGWYPKLEEWPSVVPNVAMGEWYAPNRAERNNLKAKNRPLWDHVMQGGLLLRPVSQEHVFPGTDVPPDPAATTAAEPWDDAATNTMEKVRAAVEEVRRNARPPLPSPEELSDAPSQG